MWVKWARLTFGVFAGVRLRHSTGGLKQRARVLRVSVRRCREGEVGAVDVRRFCGRQVAAQYRWT